MQNKKIKKNKKSGSKWMEDGTKGKISRKQNM